MTFKNRRMRILVIVTAMAASGTVIAVATPAEQVRVHVAQAATNRPTLYQTLVMGGSSIMQWSHIASELGPAIIISRRLIGAQTTDIPANLKASVLPRSGTTVNASPVQNNGLHLNAAGYARWATIMNPVSSKPLPATSTRVSAVRDNIASTNCGVGLDHVGGCPVSTPTYIVDSTASNDLGDGLTHATRWKTIAKVNASVTTPGADVCLMTGSQWTEKLSVDWSGLADGSDDVVIQSCYLDTSNVNAVTAYSSGSGNGRGSKAGFGYETNATCLASATCTAFGAPSSVNSTNDHQVEISTEHDVQLLDFKIEYTAGRGLGILGSGNSRSALGSTARIRVSGVDVAYTGRQSIRVANGTQGFVIENSSLTEQGQCQIMFRGRGKGPCSASCCGGALLLQQWVSRGLIENNDVYNHYGEGFGNNRKATYIINRGNRAGNTFSSTYYCDMAGEPDGGTVVFESNIAWGGASAQGGMGLATRVFNASSFAGFGSAAVEKNKGDANCLFRNNIVTSGNKFGNAIRFPLAEAGESCKVTARYFSNTVVGISGGFIAINGGKHSDGDGVLFYSSRSNIFYSPLVTAARECTRVNSSLAPDTGYNLRRLAPTTGFCVSATDSIGDPKLTTSIGTMQAKNHADKPTVDDVRLLAGSPAIGTGDPSLDDSDCLDVAGYGTWITTYMDYPFAPNMTLWGKCNAYDFNGTVRDANTPDRGAVEF